ncbi:MAG: TetR/AcrR family transcriptional regulator C-terminal domain-containing protein [Oscillospiraceae bacterium]|nr:TetR/AcrR family transcriptional regulator C-terminal domain-containing protein [Oscillospiraceae bacterium]
MNRSNNKRYQRTERMIQDRFLEILADNPENAVTVDAVCSELPINRCSFYLHHKNLQSLMDAVLGRHHEEFMNRLSIEEYASSDTPLSSAARVFIDFIIENQHFYRYYAKHSDQFLQFGQHIRDCLRVLSPSTQPFLGLSELQLSYLGEFIQAGVLTVLKRWFNSEEEEPIEEIVELFAAIIRPLEIRTKQP